MVKIAVYNLDGKKIEELELSASVFGLSGSDDLVHQVYVAHSSNQRSVIAHTKNRGERAGSGVKPWKQKGTGRARVGSVRNPLWKKGGVAFGPRNDRNFSKKVNKKMNAKAIALVLSGKAKDNEIRVVDRMELTEKKTKSIAKALSNLKLTGKTLIAFSDKEKDFRMFSRNISKVTNILSNQLNVYDMLNNKNLLMSKDSIKYLEEKYKK